MYSRFAVLSAVLVIGMAPAEASDRGNPSVSLDGKKVTIDYGRPALKGRPLAELITKLSADKVWRTGDDQVTTLTTETDLEIGGKRIKAGKYSLYVHLPEDGSRNLILNTDLGQPLKKIFAAAPTNLADAPWPYIGDYQAKIGASEVLRTPMEKETASATVDVFSIDLAPSSGGAKLKLSWGNESWSIDLKPAK
jgi:hypothetical protein